MGPLNKMESIIKRNRGYYFLLDKKMKKSSELRPNRKSAADLPSILLFFAEPEVGRIEDDSKAPIYLMLGATVPYQSLSNESTLDLQFAWPVTAPFRV